MRFSESSVLCGAGNHADDIRQNLKESAPNLKAVGGPPLANGEHPVPQEGHKGGMPRQNPHLSVERGRDHLLGLAVEDRLLRRNDDDAHQADAIFLACATTSSMPPCM